MARLPTSITIDTSKIEGLAEFLLASGELDRVLGLSLEDEPGALSAAITRWRAAAAAMRGPITFALEGGRTEPAEIARIVVNPK